ncbi:MAG: hypothetical protein ACRCVE_13300, partial [Plesiomonas sp.]
LCSFRWRLGERSVPTTSGLSGTPLKTLTALVMFIIIKGKMLIGFGLFSRFVLPVLKGICG